MAVDYLANRRLAKGRPPKASTKARAHRFLELLTPTLGSRPLASITAPELLLVLRRIEADGRHETAHRCKQLVGRVLRHAGAHDITADLRNVLTPVAAVHHPAITEPKRVGELLRAIDGYEGQPSVMAALKLAPLVFVRVGELRAAEWSEFDGAEWRIPAERMKMNERHIVPLSTQGAAIIEKLKAWTGNGRLLFPGIRGRDRPINENTLNAALRRLGYTNDEMTGHGFRTIASTLLNELNFHADLIELQLAHRPRGQVRAAYNRAERLAERRTMMQAWADYLDGLKSGAKVTAIRSVG